MPKKPDKQVTVTMSNDEYKELEYFANKKGVAKTEYVRLAIERSIKYDNHDYELPANEIARYNELMESVKILASNVGSLQDITIKSFSQLLNLANGDNDYLDDDKINKKFDIE